MKSLLPRSLTLIGVASISMVCAFGPAFALGTSQFTSNLINEVLPGASSLVQPINAGSTSNAAQVLDITLPPQTIPQGLTTFQESFLVNEIGWKANLIGGLVFQNDPTISQFNVAIAGTIVPEAMADTLHGGFTVGNYGNPASSVLDSLSQGKAVSQLESNITTLDNVLGSGSGVTSTISVIPLVAGTNDFGLQVNVTVPNYSTIAEHRGDIIYGLQTGLTGSFPNNLIEGLAVIVTASDGSPLIGSWVSTRSMSGTLEFGANGVPAGVMSVDASFPNLTGGPTSEAGTTGAPTPRSHINPISPGERISLGDGPRSHAGVSESGDTWLISGFALITLVAALVLIRRQRRTALARR